MLNASSEMLKENLDTLNVQSNRILSQNWRLNNNEASKPASQRGQMASARYFFRAVSFERGRSVTGVLAFVFERECYLIKPHWTTWILFQREHII